MRNKILTIAATFLIGALSPGLIPAATIRYDFAGDGRLDLCVSQNGAATRLFRNLSAPPGIRVRLEGPPGNPTGVGAQVRCAHTHGIKEVHAGSGYWSQDSAVLVFPRPQTVSEISVRWPGGKETVAALKSGEHEFVVRFPAPPKSQP